MSSQRAVRNWATPRPATRLLTRLAGSLVVLAVGLGLAPSAWADYDTAGYVNALRAAGLMDDDRDPCNIVNGLCHGQFPDPSAALQTGVWVCRQVEQGRARADLVYELSHGEGLMPSSYNAPVIYDAATDHLC